MSLEDRVFALERDRPMVSHAGREVAEFRLELDRIRDRLVRLDQDARETRDRVNTCYHLLTADANEGDILWRLGRMDEAIKQMREHWSLRDEHEKLERKHRRLEDRYALLRKRCREAVARGR